MSQRTKPTEYVHSQPRSYKARDWVDDHYLWADNATQLAVLYAIARYVDNGTLDGCRAFQETLAKRARCSVRTFRRQLKDLMDRKVVLPGDRRVVEHLPADRRPEVYALNRYLPLAPGELYALPEDLDAAAAAAPAEEDTVHQPDGVSAGTVHQPDGASPAAAAGQDDRPDTATGQIDRPRPDRLTGRGRTDWPTEHRLLNIGFENTGDSSLSQGLSPAERVARAGGLTDEREIARFVRYTEDEHSVRGPGWWIAAERNHSGPRLVADWREIDAVLKALGAREAAKRLPPWCGQCGGAMSYAAAANVRWRYVDNEPCSQCHPDAVSA